VTVVFDWTHVGSVKLDEADGRLRFPTLPRAPGVYQLDLTTAAGDRTAYVGETDNLLRRAQNYRTPGPRQRTSLRLNARMVEVLAGGGAIVMATATEAELELDDWRGPLDLSKKSGRLLAESAALLIAGRDGVRVENL
jgi:hypothetical protein